MTQRLYGLFLGIIFTASAVMAQEPLTGWWQELEPQYAPEHPQNLDQLFSRAGKEQALLKEQAQFKLSPGQKGRWWSNPQMVEMLGLTGDQVKKMDDIFQQHRLKLIDLNASLEKEEAILEPLVGADQPDDSKVVAQIDRVAQARAELEKANSRMLWSVRRILTREQWKKLQSEPLKGRLKY